jgi:hypothetical protein
LIASDRNIRVDHNRISIRISSSSWFKFPIWTTRWEETSPPPHRTSGTTEPQSATVKKFHTILNLKFNLNGKERKRSVKRRKDYKCFIIK